MNDAGQAADIFRRATQANRDDTLLKGALLEFPDYGQVVMTGDPNQIDNPYVDALSNGLTYTVERFKESHLAGHVTLRKGERSELAELAARLL